MTLHHEINHDSGGSVATHWDQSVTDTGSRLSITAGAGLNESANGLNIDFDGSSSSAAAREDMSALGTSRFRMRIRIDLSNVVTSTGSVILAWAANGQAQGDIASAVITGDGGGGFTTTVAFDQDVGGQVTSASFPISATSEICIEIEMIREVSAGSNDGEGRFYINGVQKFESTDLENTTHFNDFDTIRVFANSFSSTTGDAHFDEIVVDDDNTADLGCAFIFFGYDLVIGGGQP